MASTFNNQNLFNSGPHRFHVRAVGRLTTAPLRGSNFNTTTRDEAVLEVEITQTGRLIAATESALWALFDIARGVAEATTAGGLIDHSGKSWPGMRLLRIDPTGPVDRGRVFSLPYTARYLKM
ncbi:MAG: hypothetical protein ACKVZJ_14815 [Phycisphaerales bacterium]